MRKFLFAFIFVCCLFEGQSQLWDYGFGISGIATHRFNFGAGIRATIHRRDDVEAWSPQFNYYPGIFHDQGWSLGLQYQYNFRPYKKIGVYPLLNAQFVQYETPSTHYTETLNQSGNAFNYEAGIGVQSNNGCMRPFAEARYSFPFKEANVRFGFLFMMGDCFPPKYCKPAENPM